MYIFTSRSFQNGRKSGKNRGDPEVSVLFSDPRPVTIETLSPSENNSSENAMYDHLEIVSFDLTVSFNFFTNSLPFLMDLSL